MTPWARLRVVTASGSTYHFDPVDLTWMRENKNPGHENIRGMEGITWGNLRTWPNITIGSGILIEDMDTWIQTTPVVSVEDDE